MENGHSDELKHVQKYMEIQDKTKCNSKTVGIWYDYLFFFYVFL